MIGWEQESYDVSESGEAVVCVAITGTLGGTLPPITVSTRDGTATQPMGMGRLFLFACSYFPAQTISLCCSDDGLIKVAGHPACFCCAPTHRN